MTFRPDSYLSPDIHVYGDLDLSETEVSVIAEGLKVGGNLTLGPNVDELPKRMAVFGNLYIGHSQVRKVVQSDTLIVVGKVCAFAKYGPEPKEA